MVKKYYQILEINENATPTEIKRSYRKLAAKWHPDKWMNGSSQEREEANKRMREINEAFEILSDEKLKKKYDLLGETEFTSDSGGYDYEAEIKAETLRREEELRRKEAEIIDIKLELINLELKALDCHSTITEISAAFCFTLPRVRPEDLNPILWQPYQRWGEKVTKMEITIPKGKDRSEELKNFKEEMIKAIKEAEVTLRIREENKKKSEVDSELNQARKDAFGYIEKEMNEKGLKNEDLEQYSNYQEKINSLGEVWEIRNFREEVLSYISEKGRSRTKTEEYSSRSHDRSKDYSSSYFYKSVLEESKKQEIINHPDQWIISCWGDFARIKEELEDEKLENIRKHLRETLSSEGKPRFKEESLEQISKKRYDKVLEEINFDYHHLHEWIYAEKNKNRVEIIKKEDLTNNDHRVATEAIFEYVQNTFNGREGKWRIKHLNEQEVLINEETGQVIYWNDTIKSDFDKARNFVIPSHEGRVSGESYDAVFIYLHGTYGHLGDSCINESEFPHVKFISPQSPNLKYDMWHGSQPAPGGSQDQGWVNVTGDINEIKTEVSLEEKEKITNIDYPQLRRAVDYIEEIIEREIAKGIKSERIFVGGFSSGAVLTFAVATISKRSLGGFLALSGCYPRADKLIPITQTNHSNKNTPIFISNFPNDNWVPQWMGKRTAQILKECGFNNISTRFEGKTRHTYDSNDIEKFLKKHLFEEPKKEPTKEKIIEEWIDKETGWLRGIGLDEIYRLINEKKKIIKKDVKLFGNSVLLGNLAMSINDKKRFIRMSKNLLKTMDESRFVFIPACWGNPGVHWTLFVYDKDTKTIHHYNSYKDVDNFQDFLPLLEMEETFAKKIKETKQHQTPQQENAVDCGFYVCAITEFLVRRYQSSREMSWEINYWETKEIKKNVPLFRKILEENNENYFTNLSTKTTKKNYEGIRTVIKPTVVKYRIRKPDSDILTFAEFLNLLRNKDKEFLRRFRMLGLGGESVSVGGATQHWNSAYFWECIPVSKKTLNKPFEFVKTECEDLDKMTQDWSRYQEHIEQSSNPEVTSFLSLEKDAILIIPLPKRGHRWSCTDYDDEIRDYKNLKTFLAEADLEEWDCFWQEVGERMAESLESSNAPRWLSTHGLDVPYLHIRIDSRPKNYSWSEYKNDKLTEISAKIANAQNTYDKVGATEKELEEVTIELKVLANSPLGSFEQKIWVEKEAENKKLLTKLEERLAKLKEKPADNPPNSPPPPKKDKNSPHKDQAKNNNPIKCREETINNIKDNLKKNKLSEEELEKNIKTEWENVKKGKITKPNQIKEVQRIVNENIGKIGSKKRFEKLVGRINEADKYSKEKIEKLKAKLLRLINFSDIYDQEYRSEYQSLLAKLENITQTDSASPKSNPWIYIVPFSLIGCCLVVIGIKLKRKRTNY